MTILLQHRGYYGYVEVSQKNNCLHGALLNIEVPVPVSYTHLTLPTKRIV